ncbi:DUF2585 family protein [Fulvimarina sp. MAC3]|uniref:DUF2585 family protein n=1 Tax=Fulvimarina sp. MAC3 TaxID=3148887 RepID=UPI0031FC47BF
MSTARGSRLDRQTVHQWWLRSVSAAWPIASTLACLLLTNGLVVLYLWAIGRPFVAPDEPLKLFSTDLSVRANSLHLADPYSLLHAIFGIGLFLFLDRIKPHWPMREKLIVAILGSAVWEIVENTPFVVALFNDTSSPAAYKGDSIVNSVSDALFAAAGFLFARYTPLWVSLAVALALELLVSVWISDGLILGTLKLFGLSPF